MPRRVKTTLFRNICEGFLRNCHCLLELGGYECLLVCLFLLLWKEEGPKAEDFIKYLE